MGSMRNTECNVPESRRIISGLSVADRTVVSFGRLELKTGSGGDWSKR